MASVEACKDDEAFARSLQALYDADDYEGESAVFDGGGTGRESEVDTEEFIPEECMAKTGSGTKRKRLRKRRDLPSERDGLSPGRQTVPEESNTTAAGGDQKRGPAARKESCNSTDMTKLAPGSRGALYSEKEESLFLEGLNLFGRNWCKISSYVGTRDRASITSHAQKHLIQMWIRGDDLPEQMAKGGTGYSLSGKPLDPDSSSVKPYVRAYRNRVQRGEIEPAPQVEAVLKNSKYWSSIGATECPEKNNDTQLLASSKVACKKTKSESTVKRDSASKPVIHMTSPPVVGADGKTDYSRNRPQRGVLKKSKRQYLEKGYELVKCLTFSSGQPFSLIVHRIAIAVMDLHSHLLDTEIVGVLAGVFTPEKKECIVQTAIPCDRKSIDTDTTISVEATEESLAEAACTAHNLGMSIIGWYHSHPIFSTEPSYIDVSTQHEHQVAFHGYVYRDAQNSSQAPNDDSNLIDDQLAKTSDSKPFIGAICGPYNINLPSNKSEFNWFVVANPTRRQPYRLKPEIADGEIDKNNGIPKLEVEKMLNLAKMYKLNKYESERHRFDRLWRKRVSYKSKLLSSLKSWLKGDSPSDEEHNLQNDFYPAEPPSPPAPGSPKPGDAQSISPKVLSLSPPEPADTGCQTTPPSTAHSFVPVSSLLNQISLELDSFHLNPQDTENP